MKKFLSILLAVMMVLSTVSFAAPSLAGTADTAVEAPEVVAPAVDEAEDVAELAATAGDKSSYGTLVYSVDFERSDFDVSAFSTAYAQVDDNPITAYLNPDFDTSNLTVYTNAAGDGFKNAQLVTEGGNTYITGDVNAKYSGYFRMTKYSSEWPDGYYTFSVDVKAPAGQVSSFAKQCNDTALALTNIVDFNTKSGDWQTVVYQTTNAVRGSNTGSSDKEGFYGFFVALNNAAEGTVSYDNWEVYYRPATVTLTIAGVEYEVSTDAPVTVASLASKVTAPTGYILSGLSLTEGGELISDQYFFEDATLYPVFIKNPYMHEQYGNALFVVDFEREDMQGWTGHSQDVANTALLSGAHVHAVASMYDSRFAGKNFRVRFKVNNDNSDFDQRTVIDSFGNHYTEGTNEIKWPQVYMSNWENVKGDAGVYTVMVDTKTSAAPADFAVKGNWTRIDNAGIPSAEWTTVIAQQTLTTDNTNIPSINDGNLYYTFNETGVAKIAFDNFKLFYKPFTADVTLIYNGEEYVAEDVSTAGVSAASILEAAGVEIPYGKKAVLSATQGGESVGNVITLAMDSTYYVSFVADDSITEYGKRLFLIDLENMPLGEMVDNAAISNYTDDYDGDWAHLTINWAVGGEKGTVYEEDGNKIVKGTQGWAQVRINNANFESAPAGYYTMSLKTKNYGSEEKKLSTKDQNTNVRATWVKAGSVTGTSNNYSVVNGEWNEVASELNYPSQDFTIYYTDAMTTDVAFDDIALYYRPASVNLTIDNNGELTVYEDTNSVVDIDTLLADVKAPFGYKAALSTEKNGEPITGTLNLVADAKLYVVLTEDETVHFEYGKALYVIDFERESMQGWNGNSQELDNSVKSNGVYVNKSASYYDPMFEGKNYRVRFVINEDDDWLFDQKTVADANGNHYNTGTITKEWPQVYQTNYDALTGKPGYYTYMVDTYTTEANGVGFGTWTNLSGFTTIPANEWVTVIGQQELTAEGTLPAGVWFNYNYGEDKVGAVTVSFDNARLYFKPYTATVDLLANGEVVATKTGVSTAGVSVATLLDGVKVKGYAVEGVSFGGKTYKADETLAVPCDCSVELVLTEQGIDPATPTTKEEKSIRVDDPMGIRFKAAVSSKVEYEAFGWVVTRESLLESVNLKGADLDLDTEADFGIPVVNGFNYDAAKEISKILLVDDDYTWFTAVLFFSTVEADDLPSADKLADKLVARPFALVDGEYLYGEPTKPASIYDVAVALWEDNEKWNELDGAMQEYLDKLMLKVEDAGLGN